VIPPKFAACLLLTVLFCRAQSTCTPLELKPGLLIVCAKGFTTGDCRNRQAAVKLALEAIHPPLQDWRFLIVPDHHWRHACVAFGRQRWVPAFTNLESHATYLNSRLAVLFEPPGFDEELARFSPFTGVQRLEWVLGHELGHILCGTPDQEIAEDVGNRLRLSPSRPVDCRNRRYVSPAPRPLLGF